tara:strand:+ start:56 stop:943 length:888 start_codon:yes stop_codon:yes gene_type:complete
MKICDCTIFFDEKMMYEIRLNSLNDYVDKFIVAESLFTHSGKKKKQNFNINDYPKFKDKIHYILLDSEPSGLYNINETTVDKTGLLRMNSLKRIEQQYNSLSKGIESLSDDDLIILSDCDEVPKLDNLNKEKIKNNILLFQQKIFYYKFNLQHAKMNWFGSKACKKKFLKNFNWLRNIKNKKYPIWRLDTYFSDTKYTNLKIIDDGGWHFSKVKNEKDIFYTLSNYGEHNEFELSGLTESDIKNLILNEQLYFNHSGDKKSGNKYAAKIKLNKISIENMPKYLVENYSKYKEWFV